jgi:hypothetical protein
LGGRRFKSDEEVKDAVWAWLHELAVEVYDAGTQKFLKGYDKSLNVVGDYIENIKFVLFIFLNTPMVFIST